MALAHQVRTKIHVKLRVMRKKNVKLAGSLKFGHHAHHTLPVRHPHIHNSAHTYTLTPCFLCRHPSVLPMEIPPPETQTVLSAVLYNHICTHTLNVNTF